MEAQLLLTSSECDGLLPDMCLTPGGARCGRLLNTGRLSCSRFASPVTAAPDWIRVRRRGAVGLEVQKG